MKFCWKAQDFCDISPVFIGSENIVKFNFVKQSCLKKGVPDRFDPPKISALCFVP